jgi:hypothetical protein
MRVTRTNRFFLFLTLMSILLFPNCGTLFRTRTQPIPVTSSLALSTVGVNGKPQVATPVEIKLARRKRGQVIRIESPGYNPVEIQVGRIATAPNLLAEALLGALVGGMIAFSEATFTSYDDFWTHLAIYAPAGAAFRVLFALIPSKGHVSNPQDLIVTMTKADGTPRVDTIIVDAEHFQNIKWIRVHRD